jgi:transglutaminase-like putative cysteine protease
MRFEIEHDTRYQYSAPVALGPQTVRLRPRPDGAVRELEWTLTLNPEPQVRSDQLDAEGNLVARLWFLGETRHLEIGVRLCAETSRPNAFAFVPDLGANRLPMDYAPAEAAALALYRPQGAPDVALRALVAQIEAASDGSPTGFLVALNQWIYTQIEREIRDQGTAQSAAQTLRLRRGACRDQTVLFVAAARAVGLAARFVSGYQDKSAMETDRRYLHAWPEVYLPGGGWRGFDPTRGIAVADGHVPVAASTTSAGAAPVEGSYQGSARSEMGFRLRILAEPNPGPPERPDPSTDDQIAP